MTDNRLSRLIYAITKVRDMRKLLLMIALLSSMCFSAHAQESGRPCYKYIIVSMVPKERGESDIKVYLDDGIKDKRLVDEKGDVIKFSTRAGMLNYFSQKGWEYAETTVVPNGSMVSGMMSLTVMRKKATQQELDRMLESVVR